jgi:hypothetical protein
MTRLLAPALLGATLLACGGEPPPEPSATPQTSASAAVRAMLEVAEAGDWGAYVERFYGEKSKFASPAERDALVARFEGKWGERTTEALRAAAEIEPRIEGDRAIFEKDGRPVFRLFRHGEGGWKFHL